MIDFSLPYSELALALFKEQLKLEALANLSIFDSTASKDKYLAESLKFTLDTEIDFVSGGFFIRYENRIRYECLSNAVLACWLLSSGRALYSGELTQYGKLMIESVDKVLWNETERCFYYSLDFEIGKAPFDIEYEHLKSNLTTDEFKLLEGYLNKRIIDNTVACIFRNRLSEAAKFSGLLAKQAQILDGNLRTKIKELSDRRNHYPLFSNQVLETNEEACVFSCMTQVLIWHSREIELSSYQALKAKLLDRLITCNKSEPTEFIGLVYALLESLQIDWSDKLLEKARSICEVNWDDNFNLLNEYYKFHLARVYSILSYFGSEIPKVITEYLEKNPECNANIYHSTDDNNSLYFEKYRVNLLSFNGINQVS